MKVQVFVCTFHSCYHTERRSNMHPTVPPCYCLLLALLYKTVAANPEFAAVSSEITLCGLSCEKYVLYDLKKEPDQDLFYLACDTWKQERYRNGINFNKNTGCCIIENVQKNDSGVYTVLATKKSGDRVNVLHKECRVIDRIRNVTINPGSGRENISLSVNYEGDSPTQIIWSMDGGLWPEGHSLSDDNSTLTLPGSALGIYRVTVMNPVSNRSVEYTIQSTAEEPTHQVSIIGIGIGVCVSLAVVVGLVILLVKHYKKRQPNGII
ncbi:unnamed protein product [Staurois parvus]|uniref:Ig-like domain-containing protein n=1 Tax=Staurois parvus TaxID=386267 RepID=A0ABN9FWY9_9NEOB|nr:unnamed protein product [Staurois parvus]